MKLKTGEERETRRAIENIRRNVQLPEGVSFSEIKITFDDNEVSSSLIAMGLSIIFIYMLIAFLFESILMPISIVLTIPLAAIGSVWTIPRQLSRRGSQHMATQRKSRRSYRISVRNTQTCKCSTLTSSEAYTLTRRLQKIKSKLNLKAWWSFERSHP